MIDLFTLLSSCTSNASSSFVILRRHKIRQHARHNIASDKANDNDEQRLCVEEITCLQKVGFGRWRKHVVDVDTEQQREKLIEAKTDEHAEKTACFEKMCQ